MATIKQFNAIDRIGQVAQGIQKGMDNYSQLTQQGNQTLANALQLEAQRRQQALGMETALTQATGKNFIGTGVGDEYVKTGAVPSLSDLMQTTPMTPKTEVELSVLKNRNKKAQYDANQLDLPVDQRDDYKKSMAVAGVKAQSQIENMTTRNDLENKQKIKQAQIADFDIADPSVIPSQKDAEEVKSLNASNKSFQEIGARVVDRVKKADVLNPKYYISNDWTQLNQDLTKMKLQAKNLEDLGVLNGPDLGLVTQTLGDISPAKLALLGPEAAAKRVQSAMETSHKVMTNAASARNYNYNPKSASGKAPVGGQVNAGGGGMALPKVGQVMDGHVYIGGNPADPSSWSKARQ
jgi:hypothetical protein